MSSCLFAFHLRAAGLSLALLVLADGASSTAQDAAAPGDPALPAGDRVESLPPFEVSDAAEEQEYWPEETQAPFLFRKRGRFFGRIVVDDETAREELAIVGEQVAAMVDFSPGEFASVSGAETPRGFTTPRLRNGLNQSGFPEIILGGRRELLTGFLATYYGRTAPGGIQNTVSRRPAAKPTHQLSANLALAGPTDSWRVSAERNAALVPKRLHYRLTGDARWTEGPQDYARTRAATGGLTLRYAPKKETVWLVEIEGAAVDTRPSGGIPVERATRGAKQGGPYAPLAAFNTNGPNASSRRSSGSMSVLFEHQAQDDLALRGGAEVWRREQRELRFNTGAFLLDEQIFDGVREPQFNALEQSALGAEVELDGHGSLPIGDHQWLVGVFVSREASDREQRALPRTARDALPAAVRFFDPAAPDYSMTPYSPEVYSRVLAMRDEGANYQGVFWSERIALNGDRVFATAGARHDWVHSRVVDEREGATVPRAEARVDRTTYHAGVVWHMVANRLAGFFNHSTAFQPARRVDARTGRIIGNEGTSGVELGLRYASTDNRLTLTWSAYQLRNQNITRTNPLYNDPVFDPDRRQPQYVSSGEERFTGTELGLRHNTGGGFSFSGKAAWLEAITTSSPDLPEEVNRQLARLPKLTAGGSVRYGFRTPRLRGLNLGASIAWIGEHVAVYETSRRSRIEYGSYGVVNLNAGFAWEKAKRRHSLSLALRNALDRDLLAAAGRIGGERAIDAGYGVRF